MSKRIEVSGEFLISLRLSEDCASKLITEKIKAVVGENDDQYYICPPKTFSDQTDDHWKITLSTTKNSKYAAAILDAFSMLLFAYVRKQ